jgi:DNA-binding transcriptional ArsR family regulator
MRQQLSEFKADFFKALAHLLRISTLDALPDGELTVNEIGKRFHFEQANASQQLAVLRNRNIVVTRKEGANVYYSVSDKSIFKLLDAARETFNTTSLAFAACLKSFTRSCHLKPHAGRRLSALVETCSLINAGKTHEGREGSRGGERLAIGLSVMKSRLHGFGVSRLFIFRKTVP